MEGGGEGVDPWGRSWIGPVDDLKGRLRDTAGAEEGVPVGRVGVFENRVACIITQRNRVQGPAASSSGGIKFLGGIDSASQGGSLKAGFTEIQSLSLAGGGGSESDASGIKARQIISEPEGCREICAPRLGGIKAGGDE